MELDPGIRSEISNTIIFAYILYAQSICAGRHLLIDILNLFFYICKQLYIFVIVAKAAYKYQ